MAQKELQPGDQIAYQCFDPGCRKNHELVVVEITKDHISLSMPNLVPLGDKWKLDGNTLVDETGLRVRIVSISSGAKLDELELYRRYSALQKMARGLPEIDAKEIKEKLKTAHSDLSRIAEAVEFELLLTTFQKGRLMLEAMGKEMTDEELLLLLLAVTPGSRSPSLMILEEMVTTLGPALFGFPLFGMGFDPRPPRH